MASKIMKVQEISNSPNVQKFIFKSFLKYKKQSKPAYCEEKVTKFIMKAGAYEEVLTKNEIEFTKEGSRYALKFFLKHLIEQQEQRSQKQSTTVQSLSSKYFEKGDKDMVITMYKDLSEGSQDVKPLNELQAKELGESEIQEKVMTLETNLFKSNSNQSGFSLCRDNYDMKNQNGLMKNSSESLSENCLMKGDS